MKKLISFILSLAFILASSLAQCMTADEVIDHYTEVKEGYIYEFSDTYLYPWAIEPIRQLALRGIVKGTGGDKFSPEKTLSRYEYIKMITGVCGIIDDAADSPYRDVESSHWAYEFVSSAYKAGILDIYSEIILNGEAPITREEIAYISVKAMEYAEFIENDSKAVNLFDDRPAMSEYAIEPIAILSSLGVINGRGDGNFAPKDYATRAEASKIVYNILNIIESSF